MTPARTNTGTSPGSTTYPFPKAENNFNIRFWWQRVTSKVGFATNQFTAQIQAYYF